MLENTAYYYYVRPSRSVPISAQCALRIYPIILSSINGCFNMYDLYTKKFATAPKIYTIPGPRVFIKRIMESCGIGWIDSAWRYVLCIGRKTRESSCLRKCATRRGKIKSSHLRNRSLSRSQTYLDCTLDV